MAKAGITGDAVCPAAESSVSAFTCEFLLNCLIMLPGHPEKCGFAAPCSFILYGYASLSTNEIAPVGQVAITKTKVI